LSRCAACSAGQEFERLGTKAGCQEAEAFDMLPGGDPGVMVPRAKALARC
jgi:hypothetical protein